MRLLGYCTAGHHIRYIQVTNAAMAKAAVTGMPEGICDACAKETSIERSIAELDAGRGTAYMNEGEFLDSLED